MSFFFFFGNGALRGGGERRKVVGRFVRLKVTESKELKIRPRFVFFVVANNQV